MEDGKLTVRAVERALDILLCYIDETELSLTEIATRVGLHKSTVHRLLATLEGKGFMMRDVSTDKYRLGYCVWELSTNLSQNDDPAVLLLPEMKRLRDELGETVSLSIRDGMERIRIQAVESLQDIRRVAPLGARLPLTVGASGKVLVAFAGSGLEYDIMHASDKLKVSERVAFSRQLEETRLKGFATSIEERESGAAAVAAPIFNRSHKLVAALAISGPSNRLTMAKMDEYAPYIKEVAKRMEKVLK